MNANKKLTVGVFAIAALLLTGCGDNVPSDDNRNPYSGATSTSSAAPTSPATPPATAPTLDDSKKSENPLGAPGVSDEEAKKNKAEFEGKPLGADVDAMFANPQRVSADVLAVFPEDKNNTKQVVREAMATYQNLNILENFHQKRDATKDFELIAPIADRFDAAFLEIVKASIAKNGRFNHMLTVPGNGVIDYKGTAYTVSTAPNAFESSFNEPSVQIINKGTVEQPVDVIRIETDRTYSYLLDGGKKFAGTNRITIDVLPLSGGKWIIKEIGAKGLTIDVVDAKVPNV